MNQAHEVLHRAAPARRTFRLVYIYHPKDESARDALDDQLIPLQMSGLIKTWHDRLVLPGDERVSVIDAKIGEADLIVPLLSPDFLRSKYIYGAEMVQALKRHESHQARLIPVVVRPILFDAMPIISKLQALPDRQGRAVTELKNRGLAWKEVAQGIRRVAEELRLHRP